MDDKERVYWLTRCLKLELKIAGLEQLQRASWPLPRHQRRASAREIETMRALKRRGLSTGEVARRMRFSDTTVRRITKDMLIEREVGG